MSRKCYYNNYQQTPLFISPNDPLLAFQLVQRPAKLQLPQIQKLQIFQCLCHHQRSFINLQFFIGLDIYHFY